MTTTADLSHGWRAIPLGELFDFSNGVNADKAAYGSGIPFANVLEVITYETLTDKLIPGRIRLSPALIARYQVRHGDVLFNRTSETQAEVGLASVYVGNTTTVFGGFVFRGRPKTKLLDAGYSKYALRAHAVRQQIVARGQGGIRANIGQRDLKTVRVVVPPLEEQRQIADVLTAGDHRIAALERLIAKKEAIKQGMMQQLLTGKIRLLDCDEPWRMQRIGDFAQVIAGGTPSTLIPRYWGGNVPWMSSGELHQKRVVNVTGRITVNGLNESSAQLLPSGSVLIGLAGQGKTRGTAAITRIALTTNQSIAAILPGPEHCSAFLYYNLDGRYNDIRAMSTGGSGRGGLNLTLIRNIAVLMPGVPEQEAIAKILTDIDDELVVGKARLAKTKAIKQGMMQELLSGRTKLPAMGEAAT